MQVSEARERNEAISVRLPDGGEKAAVKGVTTPLDIANSLSKSLAKKVVVAEVDGGKWDLFRPLERDCQMTLHTFDDAKGRDVSHNRLTTRSIPKSMLLYTGLQGWVHAEDELVSQLQSYLDCPPLVSFFDSCIWC